MFRLLLSLFSLLLFACGGGNKFRATDTEDKTLFKAINALVKDPNQSNARKDLPLLYASSKQRHLNNIEQIQNGAYEDRFDGLIREYNALQNIYYAINSSLSLKELVKPVSYADELNTTKESAAKYYYDQAEIAIMTDTRQAKKDAWTLYRKSQGYIPDFMDSKLKMKEALDAGTVDVVVNDMRFNNFNTWNFGVQVNNSMEKQLVQDLGGNFGNSNGARYYTEWDARTSSLQPSIVVDLAWGNLFFNMSPAVSSYEKERSKKVKQKNSAGKEEEVTVTATLKITRRIFSARGEMEVNIRDLTQQKTLSWNRFPANADYVIETASYSGDNRALEEADYAMVNRRYTLPDRYTLLNELYRSVYSQVRNDVQRNTIW